MNYAVVSSTDDPKYAFFLPIVCRLWKEIGYEPLVLLVRGDWKKAVLDVVLNECSYYKQEWIYPVVGFKPSTAAQVSRLYATASEEIGADDWVLTSDADMLVFDRSWFIPEKDAAKFTIYGGDAYAGKPRWPICYIGARASTWKSHFSVFSGDNVNSAMGRELDKGRVDDWNLDENIAGELITPDRAVVKPRGWAEGRALHRQDRAAWSPSPGPYFDCHALRPGYAFDNWYKLLSLLRFHAPSLGDWAEGYWRTFVKETGKET